MRVLRLDRDPDTNVIIQPTKEDHAWATKARGYYTAQQLESIDNMTRPGAEKPELSVVEMIIRRRTEEVHLIGETT